MLTQHFETYRYELNVWSDAPMNVWSDAPTIKQLLSIINTTLIFKKIPLDAIGQARKM